MTQFKYAGFYDVPRYLVLRHRGRAFVLQSAFDEDIDEYPDAYSVFLVSESSDDVKLNATLNIPTDAPMTLIGKIQISEVKFDERKREFLDASFLDNLIANQSIPALH